MISDQTAERGDRTRTDKGENDLLFLKAFIHQGETSVAFSNIDKYDACHVGAALMLNLPWSAREEKRKSRKNKRKPPMQESKPRRGTHEELQS
jgi:hypothetical protein